MAVFRQRQHQRSLLASPSEIRNLVVVEKTAAVVAVKRFSLRYEL